MSSKVSSESVIKNSPQLRKSMAFVGSPRSPQPANDSHLFEDDFISRPYLPECWTDTKRMTVLMAPFRAREANPEGWDLKLNFWINCISKWTLQTHSVVFTAEDVMKAFERGVKRPDIQCLRLVLSHMKRNKNILNFDEFSSLSDSNKNWINWGFNAFVVKPFTIGWSLVSNSKNSSPEEIDPEISSEKRFVMSQTLQVMSEELNKKLNQLEDIDCIRFDNLFHKCKNQLNVNLETFEIIVSNLELENKLKVFVDNGIKIVKIGKNLDIKESDIGLIRLQLAKELLESEVEKVEKEIESIREEAKICVHNKNRDKAVVLLKRKKRVENKLSKKVVQLDNVDLLIDQLLNSSSHTLVLQAFQRANEALKLANSAHEDIENTMSEVEETMDVVNEIVADVSRPLVSNQSEDIDDELEDLLNELKTEESNPRVGNESKEQLDEELVRVLDSLSVNDDSLTEPKSTEQKVVPLEAA